MQSHHDRIRPRPPTALYSYHGAGQRLRRMLSATPGCGPSSRGGQSLAELAAARRAGSAAAATFSPQLPGLITRPCGPGRDAAEKPGSASVRERRPRGVPRMTFRTLGHRRLIAVIGAAVVAAIAAVASGIFTGNASGAKGSNQQHADRYKHSFDNGPPAGEEHGRDRQRYTIGLFGDMPYGALGRSQYPNLLADINHHRVAFSIFVSRRPSKPAAMVLVTTASIRQPSQTSTPSSGRLSRVPGDNDWTDCWGRYGPAQMPYHDPIERLNHERQLFDATNQSLGHTTLTLTRESREGGRVRAVLRERPLGLRPRRLYRTARPGLQRQLPLPRYGRRELQRTGP